MKNETCEDGIGIGESSLQRGQERRWKLIPSFVGLVEGARRWRARNIPVCSVVEPGNFANTNSNSFRQLSSWSAIKLDSSLQRGCRNSRRGLARLRAAAASDEWPASLPKE